MVSDYHYAENTGGKYVVSDYHYVENAGGKYSGEW